MLQTLCRKAFDLIGFPTFDFANPVWILKQSSSHRYKVKITTIEPSISSSRPTLFDNESGFVNASIKSPPDKPTEPTVILG
jgi:hypothetical protein